jgi:hypothetical protein
MAALAATTSSSAVRVSLGAVLAAEFLVVADLAGTAGMATAS